MGQRKSKKRLSAPERLADAKRWLKDGIKVALLTDGYMKRYGLERELAREELCLLGYGETVLIEDYQRDGVEWEYLYDATDGELKPVPVGTQEHELYQF